MKILGLGLMAVFLSTVNVSANALHLNPRQPGSKANMQTFGRTSIPLGYFLYSYYDRYAGVGSDDVFKAYLKTRYDESTLANFEHSLFQLSDSSELETAPSILFFIVANASIK